MSARHTNTLYKISGKNGAIVWRLDGLSGPKSDFVFDDTFSGQHHSRVLSQNDSHTVISVLDNAISDNTPESTNPYSRGLVISLRTDQSPMRADTVAHYDHPQGDYSHGRGSMQVLPNGNAFCGWAQYSLHSEYKENGDLIMEASLIPELKSYRAYKYEWIGRPMEDPAVYSVAAPKEDGSTQTAVYISWNGATEVVAWNLYKSTPEEAVELVASTPRRGFETALLYDGFASYVVAEALSLNGTVLRRSAVTKTSPPSTKLLDPARLREQNWIQNYMKNDDSESQVPIIIIAFAGGFIACAAVAVFGFAIWRCVARRKRSPQVYEPVLDDEIEGSTFVDDSDDASEKNDKV